MNQTAFASQFRQTLVYLRSSLWFVPSLLILAAVTFFITVVALAPASTQYSS